MAHVNTIRAGTVIITAEALILRRLDYGKALLFNAPTYAGYLIIVLGIFTCVYFSKKSRSSSIALFMVVDNGIAIGSHCHLVDYTFVIQ